MGPARRYWYRDNIAVTALDVNRRMRSADIKVQFVAGPRLLMALGVALGADVTRLRQFGARYRKLLGSAVDRLMIDRRREDRETEPR